MKLTRIETPTEPLKISPDVIASLPESTAHTTVNTAVSDAAKALSQNNTDAFQTALSTLDGAVRQLEEKGYQVSRESLMKTVKDIAVLTVVCAVDSGSDAITSGLIFNGSVGFSIRVSFK